ncbi:MAG: hypothetical protein WB005_17945 [Pseudolabrys sp.]
MQREEDRKRKYFALMERYNRLGRLLPAPDDLDTDDAAAVAEARLIIAEMNATQAKWKPYRTGGGSNFFSVFFSPWAMRTTPIATGQPTQAI